MRLNLTLPQTLGLLNLLFVLFALLLAAGFALFTTFYFTFLALLLWYLGVARNLPACRPPLVCNGPFANPACNA